MEISYRLERCLDWLLSNQEAFASFVTSQQSNERQCFLLIIIIIFLSALVFGIVCLHPLGSIIYRNAFYKDTLFVEGILG